MFISYEELKEMEGKYVEELRNAQSHLDVIRELIKVAEEKEPVKSECDEVETEEVSEFQEETTVEEITE